MKAFGHALQIGREGNSEFEILDLIIRQSSAQEQASSMFANFAIDSSGGRLIYWRGDIYSLCTQH
jgi:hypothetical protein